MEDQTRYVLFDITPVSFLKEHGMIQNLEDLRQANSLKEFSQYEDIDKLDATPVIANYIRKTHEIIQIFCYKNIYQDKILLPFKDFKLEKTSKRYWTATQALSPLDEWIDVNIRFWTSFECDENTFKELNLLEENFISVSY